MQGDAREGELPCPGTRQADLNKREAAEADAAAKERASNPKLQTQFADLKRSLTSLSDSDWNSIPEAGNLTGKRRKHNLRLEENQNGRSYAVSDTVMADMANRNALLENSMPLSKRYASRPASMRANGIERWI